MHTQYIHELPSEWAGISDVFVALGDPQRQRLVLAFEKGEQLTAGQVASASPLSRATVSHHLKILRQANVLLSEKRGKEVYYWLNAAHIGASLQNVINYLG